MFCNCYSFCIRPFPISRDISCSCIVVSDLLSDTHQLVHLLKLVSLREEGSAEIHKEKMAHVRREAEKRVKVPSSLSKDFQQTPDGQKGDEVLSPYFQPCWPLELDCEAPELSWPHLSTSNGLSLVTWSLVLCYDSPSKLSCPYSQALSLLSSSFSSSSVLGLGVSHILCLEWCAVLCSAQSNGSLKVASSERTSRMGVQFSHPLPSFPHLLESCLDSPLRIWCLMKLMPHGNFLTHFLPPLTTPHKTHITQHISLFYLG